MSPTTKEAQRAELHKTIWRIANDLREGELEAIITHEDLRADRTREFIDTAFRDGAIRTSDTATTNVLPPASRFNADGGHGEKKQRVIEKLGTYSEQSFGLSAENRR